MSKKNINNAKKHFLNDDDEIIYIYKIHMKHILIQFFKFGIVGTCNTAIGYGIYSALVYMGVYYIAASVTAFVLTVLNSFYWNGKYVFKPGYSRKRDALRALARVYAAYAASGLVIQNLILFIIVENFGVSRYIAPFFGMAVTVPMSYAINRQWAFRPAKQNNDS